MSRSKPIVIVALLVIISVAGWSIYSSIRGEELPAPPTPRSPEAQADQRAERRRQAEETRKAREAEAMKKETERWRQEDAELAAALEGKDRQRITALPKWVQSVYIDPVGRTWFRGQTKLREEEALRLSVKEAWAGKTRVIRGGTPLLVDRVNRVWARYRSAKLIGFDGTNEITRYPIVEPPAPRQSNGSFAFTAWSDSRGNAFFIGGDRDKKLGIHRCSAEGTWEFFEVDKDIADRSMFSYPDFVELPDGTVLLCRVNLPDSDQKHPVVLRFKGRSWERLNPKMCPQDHSTTAIIPFPDGSIGTICDTPGKLWVYWPDEFNTTSDAEISALIGQLEDPDPIKRDQATKRLIALGARATPAVEAALNADPIAEARLRLEAVRRSHGAPLKSTTDDGHDAAQAYGGRFIFDRCSLASRRDGRTVLYVQKCLDLRNGQKHPRALLTIHPDGTWDGAPIPVEQWDQMGWRYIPKDKLQDSRGRIWIEDNLRTNDKLELETPFPAGVEVADLIGEDAAGRFFFRSVGEEFVLDESIGAQQDALASVTYKFRNLAMSPMVAGAWALYLDNVDPPLQRLVKGKWEPVTPVVEGDLGQPKLVPLKNGAVLLDSHGINLPFRISIYDGKQWHPFRGVYELMHQRPDLVQQFADDQFTGQGPLRVASDDRGHVWYFADYYDDNGKGEQVHRRLFEHYDGARWHDLSEHIGNSGTLAITDVVGSVDRGRNLLAYHRNEGIFTLLSFEDGSLKQTPVETEGQRLAHSSISHQVRGVDGDLWLTMNSMLLRYRAGAITATGQTGAPLLVDSSKRLWFADRKPDTLKVLANDQWHTVTVRGIGNGSAMIESPDGRLWLLHLQGISQMACESRDGSTSIREKGRWNWGSAKNAFPGLFCDDAGGIWFQGGDKSVTRYQLPPEE